MTDTAPVSGQKKLTGLKLRMAHASAVRAVAILQWDNTRLIAENERLTDFMGACVAAGGRNVAEIATLHARIETLRDALEKISVQLLSEHPNKTVISQVAIMRAKTICREALAQSAEIEGRK